MIKVIPFEPEHIYGIEPLIDDKELKELCCNREYLLSLQKMGPCYSGFTKDGKVVGACGVRQLNAKTYEGWAILSKDSKPYAKSIIRAVDLFIKNMFDFDAADRFQATVRMNFTEGHRFAKILGFSPEGILKNYEFGEDFMMYSRVNTWLK